jgi:hydroxyacylglutathione hydrolase
MVETLTVGPFQENCYLFTLNGELVVIDPGDEAARLQAAIEATGLTPKYILLTHAHLDHVGAAAALQTRYGTEVYLPRAEAPILENLPLQCQLYGLPPITPPRVDHWLEGGEKLPFGEDTIEVILTPGHSPGGTCFKIAGIVFVGDVIFQSSVGRTDLWGGDWPTLKASIENQLFTLADEILLYPGHGPMTTVGSEKHSNPFFV